MMPLTNFKRWITAASVASLLFTSGVSPVHAAPGEWAFRAGDILPNKPSVFGDSGQFAPGTTPGARDGSVEWTDAQGRFWIFGGLSYDGNFGEHLNELWSYDPVQDQWAHVRGTTDSLHGIYGTKGQFSLDNFPGARDLASSWTDPAGNFWLFGGSGYDDGTLNFGYLNDLWKYDTSLGQWAHFSGATTATEYGRYGTKGSFSTNSSPGSRFQAATWTDSTGDLWLFGGYGHGESTIGYLNDLWRYNPASNQWAFISGQREANGASIYGEKGEFAPAYMPGARADSKSWLDKSGNLWIFGGITYSPEFSILTEEIWKYNITLGQWTLIRGVPDYNIYGEYGPVNIPSKDSYPGSRFGSCSWTDTNGDFWIFGGIGYSYRDFGYLNDLWRYSPDRNLWAYMGGSKTPGADSSYAEEDIFGPTNGPGARVNPCSWTDTSGTLYLFGGSAAGETMMTATNDVWQYDVPGSTVALPPVLKVSIKLNFAMPEKDSITLTGALPVPAQFTAAGKTISISLGGVSIPFNLDDKGSAKLGSAKVSLKVKSKNGVVEPQLAKFQMSIKGDFSSELAPLGMTDGTVSDIVIAIPVTIQYGSETLSTTLQVTYKAKQGKSGMAK